MSACYCGRCTGCRAAWEAGERSEPPEPPELPCALGYAAMCTECEARGQCAADPAPTEACTCNGVAVLKCQRDCEAAPQHNPTAETERDALRERCEFLVAACRDAQSLASRYGWALKAIADMDAAGQRADDLGRAARMARDTLLGKEPAAASSRKAGD